jgi:hypothetical protein
LTQNRTLIACEKYDVDPVLDAICRKLSAAKDSGDLDSNPQTYRVDIYTVLNYLESVAIGARRGLYCRKVVRDHMEPIMVGYVEEYINTGLVSRAAAVGRGGKVVTGADYQHMIALVRKWSHVPWYRKLKWAKSQKSKQIAAS